MPKSPFTRKPMRRTCWKWKIHGSFSQLWIRSTMLCPSILGTLIAKQKPKWELLSVSLINSWYLSRSCTKRKVSYTIFDPFFSALAIWRGIFNSQQQKKIKKIVKKPKWEASSVSLINSWYLFRSCTRRKVNYTIFDPFFPCSCDLTKYLFISLAIWRDIFDRGNKNNS